MNKVKIDPEQWNKQTAYITLGLPGSGKTTWAKEMIAGNYKVTRVNNDDIREELFGKDFKWSSGLEKQVKTERLNRIQAFLEGGYSVIIDNTHLNPKTLNSVKKWLGDHFPKVEVVEVDFRDVPVHTCIDRDRAREARGERFVGAEVILKMARSANIEEDVPNPVNHDLPWCIISDLDGTLALFGNRRNPYDASNCDVVDEPNEAVRNVLLTYFLSPALEKAGKVFFFSGRTDKYKDPTIRFLKNKCGFDVVNMHFFELVMRREGDFRADEILKKEMYDTHIAGKYNVLFLFDDRPKVIRMWKTIGLPVFNVGSSVEF